MLGPPSTSVIAGLEVVVAAGFLGFGLPPGGRAGRTRDVDAIGRWGLAFPGLAGFSVGLMLLHASTCGRILSNPWLVRGSIAVVVVALVLRKARSNRGGDRRID